MSEHRTIEINKDQLDDIVIAHLYAMGVLNDNEEVESGILYPMGMEEMTSGDLVPLEMEITLRYARRR